MPEGKLGSTPSGEFTDEERERNNLPDVLMRWEERNGTERNRPRTAQSFCVSKTDIATNGYELSLNRYKETEHQSENYDAPSIIIAKLKMLEMEIQDGVRRLEELLL